MLVMPPTLTPTLFPTRRSSDLHAFAAGLWDRRPMFTALDGDRVVWADGTTEAVDTVLLATGYLPSVRYLRDLGAIYPVGLPLLAGGISTSNHGMVYMCLSLYLSIFSTIFH